MTDKRLVASKTVRRWATGRGREVGHRGRLPESVVKEFNKLHRTRVYDPQYPLGYRPPEPPDAA